MGKTISPYRLKDIDKLKAIIHAKKNVDIIYADVVEFRSKIKCGWNKYIHYIFNYKYSHFVQELDKIIRVYDKEKVIIELTENIERLSQETVNLKKKHQEEINELTKQNDAAVQKITEGFNETINKLKTEVKNSNKEVHDLRNECIKMRNKFSQINPISIAQLQKSVGIINQQLKGILAENAQLKNKLKSYEERFSSSLDP